MSRSRQNGEPAVRAYAVTHPSGEVVMPQSMDWDQLLYASRGVMSVHAGDGTWVAPPHRAVWVPAGVPHRIVMAGRVSVRSLYFATGVARMAPGCRVVSVPPLLRELILHAVALAPLWREEPAQRRLIGVILDEMTALPAAPLHLPLPRDRRALRVAQALLADPACGESLEALAARAGTTVRTVERAFQAETSLTVDQWRRRARVIEALRLLGSGEPVTAVALAVGYTTPSAFAAMFKLETGMTPRQYFAE